MVSIRKNIPNTITSMNLLCGVLGILSCLKGDVPTAFYLMLAASVFDFCDGLAARVLHAYSPMGKELDSLSDMVSFGVLPSVMLVCFAEHSFLGGLDLAFNVSPFIHWLVVLSPVLVAVFSGLRLAKFNTDERQSENFIGLATPAGAIFLAALVCFAMKSESGFAACHSRSPACLRDSNVRDEDKKGKQPCRGTLWKTADSVFCRCRSHSNCSRCV